MSQETFGFTDVVVERNIAPRPYQIDFDTLFHASVAAGHENNLGVLPTGAGKTASAGEPIAKIIEGDSPLYQKGNVCWLAHTRGLVIQGRDSLHDLYGMDGGVEMGATKADGNPLVFSTIQSMNNRIKSRTFARDHWDLMIVDEAHRILSQSYKRATNYFTCPVLGITATPRRGDQRDLMGFFHNKFIDIPLSELIPEFLCRLVIENFPLEIDLTQVKSKGGDFDEAELGHAIEPYLGACAAELSRYKGRKMLIFLPLISTSKLFRQYCSEHGLKIKHLDGSSTQAEIEQAIGNKAKGIVGDVEAGVIDGVCNSMLLTEGMDMPWADLLLNLRPTKSWTLYNQINGRLTRLFPGKENGLILDPLWLCEDHSMLKRPSCLIAKDEEEEEGIDELLAGGGDLLDSQGAFASDREEKLRERLERNAKRKKRTVDAMEFFLSIGDIDNVEYEPMARWESDDMTAGQKEMLIKNGLDISTVQNKGHASHLIAAIIERGKSGLSTIKQCRYAAQLGMENPWGARFEEVSAFISEHK